MPKIMKSFNSISRCQSTYRCAKFNAKGICPNHHAFILIISKNPGYSQEDITREICLNKSTVARTLNHLENYGYITRKPNPDDKRQFLVYPTEKMVEILPCIRAVSCEWNNLITQGISEDELQIFHSVLNRMEKTQNRLYRSYKMKRILLYLSPFRLRMFVGFLINERKNKLCNCSPSFNNSKNSCCQRRRNYRARHTR